MNREPITSLPLQFYNTKLYNSEGDGVYIVGRIRLFYKGLNRNGSFITEAVAQQLIESVSYKPIKGVYNKTIEDFSGHEEGGKAYGCIPAFKDCNFAWEMNLDDDGYLREYACVDAILWTGIYEEAEQILGKSQSMELDPRNVEGEWIENGDDFYFLFTKAKFLAAQILGNSVEPCFEGAQFFELADKMKNFNKQDGGTKKLDLNKLKELGVDFNTTLKPFDNENTTVSDIGNSQYLVTNYSVTEDKMSSVVISTKSDGEINIDNVSEIANYSKKDGSADNKNEAEVNAKITSLDFALSNQVEANVALAEANAELETKFEAVNAELNELKEFKLNFEKEEKEALLSQHKVNLTDEQYTEYTEKLENYSISELEKDLGYTAFKNIKDKEKSVLPNFENASNTDALSKLIDANKGGNQ